MDLRQKRSKWIESAEFILRLRWVWILFLSIFFFLKLDQQWGLFQSGLDEIRMQHKWVLQYFILGEKLQSDSLLAILKSSLFWLLPIIVMFLAQAVLKHRWLLIGFPVVFVLQWQLFVLSPEQGVRAFYHLSGYAGLCLVLFLFSRFSWAGIVPIIMATTALWWIQTQTVFANNGVNYLAQGLWLKEIFGVFVLLGLIRFSIDFNKGLKEGKPKNAALVYAIDSHLKILMIVWGFLAIVGGFYFVQYLNMSPSFFFLTIVLSVQHIIFTTLLFPSFLSILPFDKKKK